jgi:hypothetical protein
LICIRRGKTLCGRIKRWDWLVGFFGRLFKLGWRRENINLSGNLLIAKE